MLVVVSLPLAGARPVERHWDSMAPLPLSPFRHFVWVIRSLELTMRQTFLGWRSKGSVGAQGLAGSRGPGFKSLQPDHVGSVGVVMTGGRALSGVSHLAALADDECRVTSLPPDQTRVRTAMSSAARCIMRAHDGMQVSRRGRCSSLDRSRQSRQFLSDQWRRCRSCRPGSGRLP